MAIVAPDVGEVLLLRYMLNHTAPSDVKMRLFVNDITPSESDLLGTYTEAIDVAYSNVTLTGVSWTVSTAAGVTTGTFAQQEFSFSSSASVFGYFVTDNAGANLLWSERFDAAPFSLPSGGGTIAVDPAIELD